MVGNSTGNCLPHFPPPHTHKYLSRERNYTLNIATNIIYRLYFNPDSEKVNSEDRYETFWGIWKKNQRFLDSSLYSHWPEPKHCCYYKWKPLQSPEPQLGQLLQCLCMHHRKSATDKASPPFPPAQQTPPRSTPVPGGPTTEERTRRVERSTTQNESKGPRQAVLLGRFSFRLLPTWGTAFGMIQAMPNEHVLRVWSELMSLIRLGLCFGDGGSWDAPPNTTTSIAADGSNCKLDSTLLLLLFFSC